MPDPSLQADLPPLRLRRHKAERQRFFTLLGLLALFLVAAPARLVAAPEVLHRQVDRQKIAGGVELIRIRQLDSAGWLNIAVLEIDHTEPHLHLDAILGNDRLTGSQPLSITARKRNAIAAINGDFFHILTTKAPLGIHLQSGELFKSGGDAATIGFSAGDGFPPFIGAIAFSGTVAAADGSSRNLSGWNAPAAGPNGLVHYNRRWGATAPGSDSADMAGAKGLVHVILDRDQRVVQLLLDGRGPPIPDQGAVLLGRGTSADWLIRKARPGHPLTVRYSLNHDNVFAAVSGRPVLLRDGAIVEDPNKDVHPRSAVGFNRERTRSWWVVVDGRSAFSRGLSLDDMAKLMQDFGAHDALNLDGGGSSTLLAREPGAPFATVQNITSDGQERDIPNGLALFHSAPTGSMNKLLIQQPSPANLHLIEPAELRLAPGATHRPVAFATDANRNPVDLPAPIAWSVAPETLGSFSSDGTFQAGTPGRGKLLAAVSSDGNTFTAELPVRVIGEPVVLEIVPSELSVSPGQEVELTVKAVDARGFAAPLAPENVTWEVRGGIGTVSGGKFITGNATGSGALHARFGNLSGVAPVGIGERPVLLAGFHSADDWKNHAVPEETTSELSFVNHLPYIRTENTPAAKLAYDFSGTSRIRAAYLQPRNGPMQLPGRPLRLGLWVYGDGKEAWLRAQIADATGTARAIDFIRNIDWTGWRYVQAEIPPGTNYPITLRSVYVVETRPDAAYSGTVYLDELFAVHSPDIDPAFLTEETPVRDPANRVETIQKSDSENFQFIVFGDSKVQANQPDSAETKILSSLIEEINRHEVEFILFTGDLIENDTEANYRFGKSFLDRLRKPVFITVANHEIAGTDRYDRYRNFFGETTFNFVHGNSEFFVLNTARPGLRVSDEQQWPWLQTRLAESEADNLFIMTHTPVIDPMPGGKTGWSDEGEIAIFQDLLTKETEKGGNVYVFHGHVHGFDRRPFDGVQYLTSAGAGSSLYLPPDRGGFFHYVVVTVKGKDVSYQVIPLLEAIGLAPRFEVRAGETVPLNPRGIAPGGLVDFPLQYPATVEWIADDPQRVRIDAATGTLHGLVPGETTITVRSGGLSASAQVTVLPH